MLIKNMSVSGWRSFSPGSPIKIPNFGKANLLVGPNNVGKSNLGRFLVRIRDILANNFRSISPWSVSADFSDSLAIHFATEEIDFWLREASEIFAEIEIFEDALAPPKSLPTFITSTRSVRFLVSMKIDRGQGTMSVVPLTEAGIPVIRAGNGASYVLKPDGDYTELKSPDLFWRGLSLAACKCIATSILEIKPLRDPSRGQRDSLAQSTNGGEIVKSLEAKQNDKNQQKFWMSCRKDLENWFSILLGEDRVRIEINDGNFWLTVIRGEQDLRCALSDLGSGVSEILMILAYLRLNVDQRYLVVLDEPEAHLHPGAVVELAKIITSSMPNHQLLITTHSTSLVDAISSGWHVYRISRSSHGGTICEQLDTDKSKLSLISDLGLLPSQLFLARASIWVEGPSDVNYWSALLRAVDPGLVVGRDYAFVMCGGSSAAQVGFSDDDCDLDGLVYALRISNKAIISCDRDCERSESDRPLIRRLHLAASRLPDNALVSPSIGREIENGILPDVLARVLKEFLPKRLNDPDGISLTYDDIHVGKDDSFDEVVANAARPIEGGRLTAEQRKKLKNRIAQKKMPISARVRELSESESVFREEALEEGRKVSAWLRA